MLRGNNLSRQATESLDARRLRRTALSDWRGWIRCNSGRAELAFELTDFLLKSVDAPLLVGKPGPLFEQRLDAQGMPRERRFIAKGSKSTGKLAASP